MSGHRRTADRVTDLLPILSLEKRGEAAGGQEHEGGGATPLITIRERWEALTGSRRWGTGWGCEGGVGEVVCAAEADAFVCGFKKKIYLFTKNLVHLTDKQYKIIHQCTYNTICPHTEHIQ